MTPPARARARIRTIVAGSTTPEDPVHAENTVEWLLRLDPDADEALTLAALGHDIERALAERKVTHKDHPDFEEFKAAHARNSAAILDETLEQCGVDESMRSDVYHLVLHHEIGGDPRADLLKDADSLSFFDTNLVLYAARHSREETKRRCLWGVRRLSPRAREVLREIHQASEQLRSLVDEVLREFAAATHGTG